MEVKAGQVWRWKDSGSHTKVGLVQSDTVYMDFSDGYRSPYLIREILEECELVTLDNIKPGEWVELTTSWTSVNGYTLLKGEKHKIYKIYDLDAELQNGKIVNKQIYLKPCLPPQGETMKTYSNSEIMDLMEQGYFVEGDKIKYKGKEGTVGCTFDGDTFRVANGGHTLFSKGDLWSIELVDKWEECTVQEAAKIILEGNSTEVKNIRISNGAEIENIFIDKKEEPLGHMFDVLDIAYGTWYKKVKRNEI